MKSQPVGGGRIHWESIVGPDLRKRRGSPKFAKRAAGWGAQN